MIIAVVAVRMMQSALNDVIDMIPMRHCCMTAAGAVHVALFLASGESVLAAIRVGRTHSDDVLVIMDEAVDLVRVMEMAIVKIVNVAFVL